MTKLFLDLSNPILVIGIDPSKFLKKTYFGVVFEAFFVENFEIFFFEYICPESMNYAILFANKKYFISKSLKLFHSTK